MTLKNKDSGIEKPKLLYVDSEESLRCLFSQELLLEEFEVLTACDSDEALSILANDSFLQMVITDSKIQPMDITEFITQIKSTRVDVSVIVTSGGDVKKADVFDAGANGFILKPYVLSELILKIKKSCKKL